jgi:hypothetical protein
MYRWQTDLDHGEHLMQRLTLLLLITLAAACTQLPVSSTRTLEHGYVEVTGATPEIRYKNITLCQCQADDVFISPTGLFAIYLSRETGAVTVFSRTAQQSRRLTTAGAGRPARIDWNEDGRAAMIHFRTDMGVPPEQSRLWIAL